MSDLRLEDTLGPTPAAISSIHALVSIAISLRRIADCLEAPDPKGGANINALFWEISQRFSDSDTVNR